MRIAVEKGRSVREKLKLGICGEHGGDPASVMFCDEIGLDYVSCSPFRVPIARLAAAQSAVQQAKAPKPAPKRAAGPQESRPRRNTALDRSLSANGQRIDRA